MNLRPGSDRAKAARVPGQVIVILAIGALTAAAAAIFPATAVPIGTGVSVVIAALATVAAIRRRTE